ncbi:hypothetical protein AVEN_248729-1 [Araneus ventricosus]|uniref:Glutathione peroxidase n=1 Tax=Araneus ventricosus TaxID=182803 RepID=A0A4Y2LME8_ARAVE|nr:hypothetical protein AVEN_248729-1 [Araneus ventricosus]
MSSSSAVFELPSCRFVFSFHNESQQVYRIFSLVTVLPVRYNKGWSTLFRHSGLSATDFLDNCPSTRDEFSDQRRLFYTPMRNRDIRWNFEKILVDRTGMPVMRYDPSVQPSDIAKDIDYLILQS